MNVVLIERDINYALEKFKYQPCNNQTFLEIKNEVEQIIGKYLFQYNSNYRLKENDVIVRQGEYDRSSITVDIDKDLIKILFDLR